MSFPMLMLNFFLILHIKHTETLIFMKQNILLVYQRKTLLKTLYVAGSCNITNDRQVKTCVLTVFDESATVFSSITLSVQMAECHNSNKNIFD